MDIPDRPGYKKRARTLLKTPPPFSLIDEFKKQINDFITTMCDEKSDGIPHYLCQFDKTHNKTGDAYVLNSTFFKDKKILGEGAFGKVYDVGLWTIDTESDTVHDIIIKTIKLGNELDSIVESYINFVLINTIIINNPSISIGLVITFGLFYCGKKNDEFCMDADRKEITENKDIFIVQEKKNARTLRELRDKDKTFVFTKGMLKELFKILVILEENGIYHSDLNTRNILIDNETKKLYLIDFGLASFMFNGNRYRQREIAYFNDHLNPKGVCSAFNDFFSIYRFLLEFNQKLFAEISPIIQQIFDEFNPKPLESIVNMCYPYSHYLKKVEIAYERTSTINLKVYDKYTMHKIYDMLCSSVFQAQ
jgi:serine/threonine protein kinase